LTKYLLLLSLLNIATKIGDHHKIRKTKKSLTKSHLMKEPINYCILVFTIFLSLTMILHLQQLELTRLVVAPNRTAPMTTSRARGPSDDPPAYSEATSLGLAAFNHEQPITSVKVRRCANNNKPPSDRQFLT